MLQDFDSPLRISRQTPFRQIDFGPVVVTPEILPLERELSDHIFRLTEGLPAPLAAEARTILQGYGGDGNFLRVFFQPIWSFLHWVPSRAGTPPHPDLLAEAREAHVLALFLHLWDDHLCDGQLDPDLLRLHLRTLAWQRFMVCGHSLCARTGTDTALVDAHFADYLTSLHRPAPVAGWGAYGERFRRQIAIWRLVPRLLGLAIGGEEVAGALCRLIEAFAEAWRWLDDLQDIDADIVEGKVTACWLSLSEKGRRLWSACRPDPLASPHWGALVSSITESGCLSRLLQHIIVKLEEARAIAEAQGWPELARELVSTREAAHFDSIGSHGVRL